MLITRPAMHCSSAPPLFRSTALRGGVYLAGAILFSLNYWLNHYFGPPEIHQIAYHLQFGKQITATSDPAVVRKFVRWGLWIPLFLTAIVVYLDRLALQRGNQPVRTCCRKLPVAVLVSAVLLWSFQLSIVRYAFSSVGPDYFGTHYVKPSTVAVSRVKPKNLILIYVESMEAGYSNRLLFGKDLIAPLTELNATRFDSFEQVPGTGWTIAAIVASQCALPLKRLTLFDINTQGVVMNAFLPNATCLGDILAQHGYRNVFMGGASPAFAGKGKFLNAHHYHEVYGKEDWQGLGVGASGMNGWGLFDDELFRRARAKLSELHATGRPFNLTLLTVDTHDPTGHLSSSCAKRGYAGFSGVVTCTATDVASFVQHVRDQGYLADTNIVILGDHLARQNPLTDILEGMPARSLYNGFIAETAPVKNRQQIVHFDLLPTTLEFIGFSVDGGRLGLGYSAFHEHRSRPAPDRIDALHKSVLNSSQAYRSLWSGPAP